MKKLFAILFILLFVFSANATTISDSLSAQNTFSKVIDLGSASGAVFTLSGTWTAIVSLQRMNSAGGWDDITDNNGELMTFSGDGTYTIYEPTVDNKYRWGIKTGHYTSGTVNGVIQWH